MRTNYAVRVFAPQPVKLHLADERSGALGHLDGPSICCFRCPRHCRCSSARRLVAFTAGIFKSVAMWCVSDEPRAHAAAAVWALAPSPYGRRERLWVAFGLRKAKSAVLVRA